MAPTGNATRPLVLVIGGTGLQGNGCIRDLVAAGSFRVRTLTRNATSKGAKALEEAGVEVYEGRLLDVASLERAMEGVDMLFMVTFSDHDGTEVQQGKNLGDVAVRAGVKRVVFSGGESIGVDAMDNKIKIERYMRTLPLPHVVYLHSAFFFENVATKLNTKRVKIDKLRRHYTFSIPLLRDVKVPFISPTDIGRFAALVLVSPPGRFQHGQVVPLAGDIVSPQDFVEAFSKITGKQAKYKQFSLDFFRLLPIPGAHLIVEMYEWYHKGCPGEGHDRDPAATRALCSNVRNLDEWLQSDGVVLIEQMAYSETLMTRLHDALLWGFIKACGWYKQARALLLPPPPPPPPPPPQKQY